MKICGECRSVQYCCTEHQRADLGKHQKLCSLVKGLAERGMHQGNQKELADVLKNQITAEQHFTVHKILWALVLLGIGETGKNFLMREVFLPCYEMNRNIFDVHRPWFGVISPDGFFRERVDLANKTNQRIQKSVSALEAEFGLAGAAKSQDKRRAYRGGK